MRSKTRVKALLSSVKHHPFLRFSIDPAAFAWLRNLMPCSCAESPGLPKPMRRIRNVY